MDQEVVPGSSGSHFNFVMVLALINVGEGGRKRERLVAVPRAEILAGRWAVSSM